MTEIGSIEQGRELCRAGEHERATAIAAAILQKDPTRGDALQLVEDVAFDSGDFADAIDFWLTPDEANLDPASGGLVVWDKEAPPNWDFDDYNNNPERIREFLRAAGAKPVTVPHRQNRVVIFNSDLFHKTDSYRFRPGYLNRRINVTFLYGYRQARDDPMARISAA